MKDEVGGQVIFMQKISHPSMSLNFNSGRSLQWPSSHCWSNPVRCKLDGRNLCWTTKQRPFHLFAGTNGRSNRPGKMQRTKTRNTQPKIERECGLYFVAYVLFIVHLFPFSLPCESILAAKALEDHFPDLRILQTRRIDGCHVKPFSVKKDWNWETPMDIIYT